MTEFAIERCLELLGRNPLGDVVAFAEDAGDTAVLAKQRGVDEVQVALLLPIGRRIMLADLGALRPVNLARLVDPVEKLEEALTGYIGKSFTDRLAHPVGTAEGVHMGLVDELDHVLGAAQDDDEARGLLEQAPLPLDIGCETALG